MNVTVIFYPSNYLQLQVDDNGDDFCHLYDNPNNLAKDISRLMDGDNTIGWYGNDPDAWIDCKAMQADIKWIDMKDINALLEKDLESLNLYPHELAFYQALKKIRAQK